MAAGLKPGPASSPAASAALTTRLHLALSREFHSSGSCCARACAPAALASSAWSRGWVACSDWSALAALAAALVCSTPPSSDPSRTCDRGCCGQGCPLSEPLVPSEERGDEAASEAVRTTAPALPAPGDRLASAGSSSSCADAPISETANDTSASSDTSSADTSREDSKPTAMGWWRVLLRACAAPCPPGFECRCSRPVLIRGLPDALPASNGLSAPAALIAGIKRTPEGDAGRVIAVFTAPPPPPPRLPGCEPSRTAENFTRTKPHGWLPACVALPAV